MDRPKFLLALCIISISVFLPCQNAIASTTSCQSQNAVFSGCTGAQTSNNSVNVWGRTTTPGGSSSVVTPAGRSTATRTTKPAPYYPSGAIAFNCLARQSTIAGCRTTPAPPAVTPVYYAPITLSDLANFVPQAASLTSQPRGWTVVNLNTNFIAGASVHVVSGSLFGNSAEVRFTPHAYVWSYGDGGAQTTSVAGSRWDALGLREFSPTATSHVYGSLGSFTTSASVRYGAEYRIGNGAWNPVEGEVTSSATTTVVIVQNADTVLAARDCNQSRGSQSCH